MTPPTTLTSPLFLPLSPFRLTSRTVLCPTHPQSHRRTPSCAITRPSPSFALSLTAALLVLPIFTPARKTLPPAYSQIAPQLAAVTLVAAVLARRDATAISVAEPHANNPPPSTSSPSTVTPLTEFPNHTIPNKSTFADAFSSSRAEWDQPDVSQATPDSNTSSSVYSYSYKKMTKNETPDLETNVQPDVSFKHMRDEFEQFDQPQPVPTTQPQNTTPPREWSQIPTETQLEQPPVRPLSTTSVISSVVKLPKYIFSNALIPLYQIAAVLWFDIRARSVDYIDGPSGFFLDEAQAPASGTRYSPGEQSHHDSSTPLSPEEQQVENVQQAIGHASRQVEGAARSLENSLRRFFQNPP